MKYSYKLSDAVHILAYINIFHGSDLSSATIAKSIEANPSVVRKLMASLKTAGLLTTTPGTAAPQLTNPASQISLLSVFNAVEMNHELLHVDPRTNMDCPVGANIQATLNGVYQQVQTAAEKEMQAISIQDVIDGIQQRRQVG